MPQDWACWRTPSASRRQFQFSSVGQLCLTLCDPMDCSTQASLSITNSQSLLKLMSIKSVRPSNHLILCCPLLLLPSIFPNITVYSLKTGLSMTLNNHIPLYIWSGQKSVLELAGIFGRGIAAPCEMKRLKELSFLSGSFSPTLARFIRLVSFPYR